METGNVAFDALPRRERVRRLGPFLLAFGVAFALGLATRSEMTDPGFMVLAFVITAATGVVIVEAPWSRWPSWATLGPVVALCVAVELMRASSHSSSAGYGALLYALVVWQAMRRRHRDLVLTIAAVTITNVAAIYLLPSTLTVQAQWRGVILSSVVAAMIGETTYALVRERNELMAAASDLALRDPLTGLGNRRIWDDRVSAAMAEAARTGRPLTMAMLDLDHFKAFNDRHGHARGDELLVAAAAAWCSALRGSDLLVRWGGEEFAVLLPATGGAEAAEVLSRLRQVVPFGQTASVGCATVRLVPGGSVDPAEVLRRADVALYQAKAEGRDRIVAAPELGALDPDLEGTGSGGHQVGR